MVLISFLHRFVLNKNFKFARTGVPKNLQTFSKLKSCCGKKIDFKSLHKNISHV
jgi:hypothetical protein